MRIVVTAFLDRLYELLAQGPHLVTLYERKDSRFLDSLQSWLQKSESLLEEYHRPEVSQIAGIRARLLSASNGVFDRTTVHLPEKAGRKTAQANAAILFDNAQSVLNVLYRTFEETKGEAAKYVRQIVLISLQKGTFYPVWNGPAERSAKLQALWQSFATDSDLVQGVRQVLASVHYLDGLRIMDELIDGLQL